jgi:hypothetical protein
LLQPRTDDQPQLVTDGDVAAIEQPLQIRAKGDAVSDVMLATDSVRLDHPLAIFLGASAAINALGLGGPLHTLRAGTHE